MTLLPLGTQSIRQMVSGESWAKAIACPNCRDGIATIRVWVGRSFALTFVRL